MGFWGALWFTEDTQDLTRSIQPAQWPAQRIQEWVRTAPHLPTRFYFLECQPVRWLGCQWLVYRQHMWSGKSGGG